MRRSIRVLAASLMAPLVMAAGGLTAAQAAPATHHEPASHLPRSTQSFRGVNWADPRDNYASDAVVPSGLSTSDSYWVTYRKSERILDGFRLRLGANTVRLPINPSSVGTSWWRSYRASVDAAMHHGFKVILSYWEADDAKDGKVDSTARFNAMWNTAVAAYADNPRVYFEPMNEPFGYTLDQWVSLTSGWLHRHSDVPRSRVVISGTGYNDDVTGVGAAPQLRGTLLSLHFYGFWADDTTRAAWLENLTPRIGSYAWRTVVDEAGSPMTTGLDYAGSDGDVFTAYMAALTQTTRANRMGIVYWPGLRTGDTYSITTLTPTYRLTVNNSSGLKRLQYGWGFPEPGAGHQAR